MTWLANVSIVELEWAACAVGALVWAACIGSVVIGSKLFD